VKSLEIMSSTMGVVDTGWKPMLHRFLESPSGGDGTPSLKNLFLRVQARIFSDRAQPALHSEF
jgi:hypothetical protein